ncbi:MAG: SpoIID/LytB domain-containing protein [Bryobacterales bacterium]|nr:SpoIID/LytB domain-containing protein [Bryobacterales bacterium]
MASRLFPILCLLVSTAFAGDDAPSYTVRLFWRQVPEALELAPLSPFSPKSAPLLHLSDGRQLMLRGPLRIAARGASLQLGDRFPNHVGRVECLSRLRLRIPGGTWAEFAGQLRIWASDGELHAEVAMDPEDYVRAVLAGEAGGIREPEALKAIAVAIRSYAFALGSRHTDEGFTFCDTTHCQDLRLATRHPLLDEAAEETAGEILWKDGTPVPAWHHADSGGHTEDARAIWGKDAPSWQRGQPDPSSLQPEAFTWTARIRTPDFVRALRAEGFAVAASPAPQVLARHPSGRVALLLLDGRELPASTIRFAIGRHLGWNLVRSDLYTLRAEADAIVFDGRGAGHGVGLSQRGASAMARQGKSYRDILAFYFSSARVGVAARDIRWTQRGQGLLRIWFAGVVDESFPSLALRELRRTEAASGIELRRPLTIRVYSDLDSYRNHAGNPGWMAASTNTAADGYRIALQPLTILRRANTLEPLLRHELAHALVLQEATRELPRWFHEGLARWLASGISSNSENLRATRNVAPFPSFQSLDEGFVDAEANRRAYAASTAERVVAAAIRHYGRDAVLGWVRHGPPHDDHVLLRELQHAGQR